VVRFRWRRRILPAEPTRTPHAEPAAFARDAQIAPARLLPGQPQHQLYHLEVEASGMTTPVRVDPPPSNQLPVPAQKRGLTRNADHQSLTTNR
jgi:hypothetical protein